VIQYAIRHRLSDGSEQMPKMGTPTPFSTFQDPMYLARAGRPTGPNAPPTLPVEQPGWYLEAWVDKNEDDYVECTQTVPKSNPDLTDWSPWCRPDPGEPHGRTDPDAGFPASLLIEVELNVP